MIENEGEEQMKKQGWVLAAVAVALGCLLSSFFTSNYAAFERHEANLKIFSDLLRDQNELMQALGFDEADIQKAKSLKAEVDSWLNKDASASFFLKIFFESEIADQSSEWVKQMTEVQSEMITKLRSQIRG